MKIITICGSLKFQKEMMEMAEKMALDGNCVLTPTYPVSNNLNITDNQLKKLVQTDYKIGVSTTSVDKVKKMCQKRRVYER